MSEDEEEVTNIEEEQDTVEEHFADVISASAMVPLDDPFVPGCRYGLKSCFWGPSGIGKSDIIKQGADSVGLEHRIVVPGQRQPEDFAGVPIQDKVSGELKVECLLTAVRDLNKLGKGILFVDEATTAPPAVQGSMLTMVNDGVVGDTIIEPGIRILLAANPPEMSAGGWGFEPPMANRLAHFFVKVPPVKKWRKWLLEEGDHDITPIESTEAKLKVKWNQCWAKVKGDLSGFMEAQGEDMLHNQPKSDDPKSGYAWRSPRTWWLAGRAVATLRALDMNEELTEMFIAALVGKGPSIEYMTYVAEADIPKPDEWLKQKEWNIDDTRLDKILAINMSVVSFVKGIQDKTEKYDMAAQLWKYLAALQNKELADLAVEPGDELIRAKLARKNVPGHVKTAAEPVIYKNAKHPAARYARDDVGPQ
jgi:hypothetical protein